MTASENNQVWRKKHRAQYNAIQQAWREKNRARTRLWARQNRAKDPERHLAYRRAYIARNGEHIREVARLYKYGLRAGEFEERFVAQGRTCGICAGNEHRGNGWHVDHDHVTGSFRGILCKPCNTALGTFGDSIEGLQRAVRYLRSDKNNTEVS